MLTTMLLACHVDVVGKKSLHTSVPISHFETSVILFCNIRDEQNYDISNILKCFIRGAVFLISVSEEQSGKR